MDINVQQLSNISSGSTEQANNAYNTSRTESNIQNVPNSVRVMSIIMQMQPLY